MRFTIISTIILTFNGLLCAISWCLLRMWWPGILYLWLKIEDKHIRYKHSMCEICSLPTKMIDQKGPDVLQKANLSCIGELCFENPSNTRGLWNTLVAGTGGQKREKSLRAVIKGNIQTFLLQLSKSRICYVLVWVWVPHSQMFRGYSQFSALRWNTWETMKCRELNSKPHTFMASALPPRHIWPLKIVKTSK